MISNERLIHCAALVSRWCLAAALFLVPVYFAWFQENFTVFDLNKSGALHLFVGIALVAWLIGAAVRGRITLVGGRRMGYALVALAAAFLVSTLLSLHPEISLWGSYERQQGLYSLWYYVLFLFLVMQTCADRRGLELLLRALLASTTLVCLYGLLQAFGLDPLSWGENPQQRIFSSFGQPNFLGHFLVVMLPLTVFAGLWLPDHPWWKFSYRLLIGIELACLLFTYSRSAWLALAATLAVSCLWFLLRSGKKKTAIGLVIAGVVVFGTLVLSPVRQAILERASSPTLSTANRIVSFLDFEGGSNRVRLYYWEAGIRDLVEASWQRKLFGYGPDAVASVYVRHYQPAWGYYEQLNSFPDRAHNLILDIALQFGLVGLGALVALNWIIIRRLFVFLKAADGHDYWFGVSVLAGLCAYGVNNLFSFSLTAMSLLYYALLALAWAIPNGTERREYSLEFFQPMSRFAILGVTAAFLLVLLYGYNVKPLIADYYYFRVKKAEARGDCRAMLDDMERVMTWYPISHYYARAYLHHGTNCFSAASTDEAKQQLGKNLLEEASAIPPREQQYYTIMDLAHLYSLLGYYIDTKYYPEAERLYQQLIDINPSITVAYQDYGRLKMWREQYDEAFRLYEQGLAASPALENAPPSQHLDSIAFQRGYLHELIGMVYEAKKQPAAAEREYKLALADNPRLATSLKKLADLAYGRGDLKTAIEYHEQGAAIEPRNSLWPVGLAALYKERGDRNKALEYARQGLAIEPENESIKKLIAELEGKK